LGNGALIYWTYLLNLSVYISVAGALLGWPEDCLDLQPVSFTLTSTSQPYELLMFVNYHLSFYSSDIDFYWFQCLSNLSIIIFLLFNQTLTSINLSAYQIGQLVHLLHTVAYILYCTVLCPLNLVYICTSTEFCTISCLKGNAINTWTRSSFFLTFYFQKPGNKFTWVKINLNVRTST